MEHFGRLADIFGRFLPILIHRFFCVLLCLLFGLPDMMHKTIGNTFECLLPSRLQIAQQIQPLVAYGLPFQFGAVVDPMQAGSAMPLFRQTSRRTLHGELVIILLPQDFCHCQR